MHRLRTRNTGELRPANWGTHLYRRDVTRRRPATPKRSTPCASTRVLAIVPVHGERGHRSPLGNGVPGVTTVVDTAVDHSGSLRYEALCELLAMPDPPELPKRSYSYTHAGHAARKDHIKRELAAAYVAHRMQLHGDDATIVAVRRFSMRLIRRTA